MYTTSCKQPQQQNNKNVNRIISNYSYHMIKTGKITNLSIAFYIPLFHLSVIIVVQIPSKICYLMGKMTASNVDNLQILKGM